MHRGFTSDPGPMERTSWVLSEAAYQTCPGPGYVGQWWLARHWVFPAVEVGMKVNVTEGADQIKVKVNS